MRRKYFCGGVRPLIAEAETTGTYGDLSYITVDSDGDGTDDYVEITDCDESAIEVEIPAEIEGLPVKSIGDSAFYYCRSLKKIIIPNSVTVIGENAFFYCDGLERIDIPNSVTVIGMEAFKNCKSAVSVVLPDSLTIINTSVFEACTSLLNITIPNTVTSIGDSAFNFCSSLVDFEIPASVKIIGDEAFNCCTSLSDITIPESVTEIGYAAFANCSNLKNIKILNSDIYITDFSATISNGLVSGFTYWYTGTISGYSNSTAKAYAEKYDRKFIALDEITKIIQGDISGNGSIDLYDAIEIAKSIMNMRTFTEEEKIIADYNGDGTVDLYDAIEIARTLLPK